MKKIYVICAMILALGVAFYGLLSSNSDEKVVNKISEPPTIKVDSPPLKVIKPLLSIVEGVHYDVLEIPLVLAPHTGAVISEFFWFGCPHCQNFEPFIIKWKKMLNEEMPTILSKIPASGSKRWDMDSKVFYAMKTLGATEEQVTSMLGHYKSELELNKKLPTEIKLHEFFGKVGLDADKAMAIFRDEKRLKDDLVFAEQEYKKLNADGVPAFVINGKYKVKFDSAKTYDDIYQIFRALIHKS